jgi:nucleotide-binding universal stress UspA family protein
MAPPLAGSGIGPSVPADYAGIVEEWVDRAEDLVGHVAKVIEGAGFSVATVLKEGDAKREILAFAEEWQPDLIVVGSHGRTGADRFLLGSVSEAVARHAGCSVQIVRHATAFAKSD